MLIDICLPMDQTLPKNILLECMLTLPLGMSNLSSDTFTTLLIDAANTRTQAITAALRAEAAVFSPRPHTLSMEAAKVAEAFRTMSIHTPAPYLTNSHHQ
jgi:hypothetical protein